MRRQPCVNVSSLMEIESLAAVEISAPLRTQEWGEGDVPLTPFRPLLRFAARGKSKECVVTLQRSHFALTFGLLLSELRKAATDPGKVQLPRPGRQSTAVLLRRLAGGPVGGAAPTKCLSLHPGGNIYPGTEVTPGSGHDKRKRPILVENEMFFFFFCQQSATGR